MPPRPSRRQFLAGTAALAGAPILANLPVPRAGAQAGHVLRVGTRVLEVNGRAASVFSVTGSDGKPGLTLGPGERFAVRVENGLDAPTIVHWHGMTPPVEQDGVAHHGVPLIAPGGTADYDFEALPGTHWMHSHSGFQEQMLLAAPLIVHTAEDRAADEQEVVILLHDFTFRDPAEILAGLTGRMVTDHGVLGAMMESPAGRIRGLDHHTMTLIPREERPQLSGLHDIAFDAYLANDRTLDDPEVVRVERGGRVRLRIINGSSATAYWIDLAGLEGTLIAVDGNPVEPVAGSLFPLTMGQRIDVRATLPRAGAFPVFAVREGDVQRTGIVLATPGAPVPFLSSLCARAKPIDNELEARLVALEPLPEKRPNRQFAVTLTGDLETYAWSMLDRTWNAHVPLWSHLHQRIELDLVNRTEVAHPMHLHGHMFHVMAVNGQKVRGAMRDTVHVTPGGSVRIAFDADNPGAWLLHCHNLYHMMAGMMTEVVYIGDGADAPQIARGDDYRQPAGPAPEAGDFLLREGDR